MIFLYGTASAQIIAREETLESRVLTQLGNFVTDSRSEKLYLHIDKESCLPGDTLFFKGYLVLKLLYIR